MNLKKQITGLMVAILLVPSISSAMTLEEMKETLLSISGVLDSLAGSMSAQVIKSGSPDLTVQMTKPDLTHPDSKVNYDVNRDGDVDLRDLEEMEGVIENYNDNNWYEIYYDLDQDEKNDSDDFFLLRNHLANGDDAELALLAEYDVNSDYDVDLRDLEEMEGVIENYNDNNWYEIYYDLDQDEKNDSDDFFLLRNHLANGDDAELALLAEYDVNSDYDVDLRDLEEMEGVIENYNDNNWYEIYYDLDQDEKNDSDDFFLLRNHLANGDDAELALLAEYDVNSDYDVDLRDLEEMEGVIENYNDNNWYEIYYDLDQDEKNDSDDFFLLRNHLANGDDAELALLAEYDVNSDYDVDLRDLEEMEGVIENYNDNNWYEIYYDLDQDEKNDSDDFFLLRNHLANGDDAELALLAEYDVNSDYDVDLRDLEEMEGVIENYNDNNWYEIYYDLDQDEKNDSDDYKILASYLGVTESDEEYNQEFTETQSEVDLVSSTDEAVTDMSKFGQTTDRAELEQQLQMLITLLTQLLAQQM